MMNPLGGRGGSKTVHRMNGYRVQQMTKFFEACHAHKARSKPNEREGVEVGRLRLKQKELKVMCDLLER